MPNILELPLKHNGFHHYTVGSISVNGNILELLYIKKFVRTNITIEASLINSHNIYNVQYLIKNSIFWQSFCMKP